MLWTAAIAGIYGAMLGIFDEEKTDLSTPRYDWNYRLRTPASNIDGYGYFGAWPSSRGVGGDPNTQMYLQGQDGANANSQFEPYMDVFGGTYRPYFIKGLCVDGASTPLQSVVVELFLTTTDVFVSRVQSDVNGIYSAPTPYLAQNHYAVANYGPNTLIGATVNTLQPVTAPW